MDLFTKDVCHEWVPASTVTDFVVMLSEDEFYCCNSNQMFFHFNKKCAALQIKSRSVTSWEVTSKTVCCEVFADIWNNEFRSSNTGVVVALNKFHLWNDLKNWNTVTFLDYMHLYVCIYTQKWSNLLSFQVSIDVQIAFILWVNQELLLVPCWSVAAGIFLEKKQWWFTV